MRALDLPEQTPALRGRAVRTGASAALPRTTLFTHPLPNWHGQRVSLSPGEKVGILLGLRSGCERNEHAKSGDD